MDTLLPLCMVSLTWVRKPDYSAIIDVACDAWPLFNGQELLCIPSPPPLHHVNDPATFIGATVNKAVVKNFGCLTHK